MGQSSPRPSMLPRRKSSGPKRSEMRPQWFVRPPSMRARHQSNVSPGAIVYGSPSTCQPPMHPDRKSTRLNSSHVKISYAVFCLKKNKNLFDVTRPHALVIGAGPGIGRATALALADCGAIVAAADPNREPAARTAGELVGLAYRA